MVPHALARMGCYIETLSLRKDLKVREWHVPVQNFQAQAVILLLNFKDVAKWRVIPIGWSHLWHEFHCNFPIVIHLQNCYIFFILLTHYCFWVTYFYQLILFAQLNSLLHPALQINFRKTLVLLFRFILRVIFILIHFIRKR